MYRIGIVLTGGTVSYSATFCFSMSSEIMLMASWKSSSWTVLPMCWLMLSSPCPSGKAMRLEYPTMSLLHANGYHALAYNWQLSYPKVSPDWYLTRVWRKITTSTTTITITMTINATTAITTPAIRPALLLDWGCPISRVTPPTLIVGFVLYQLSIAAVIPSIVVSGLMYS